MVEELPFEPITIEEEEEIIINPKFDEVPMCQVIKVDFDNQTSQEGIYHCQLPTYQPSSIGKTAQLSILNGLDTSIMSYNSENRTITIDRSKIQPKHLENFVLNL